MFTFLEYIMPPMPPVVMVSNREEDSVNTEPSMSGRQLIGIIYPPPDIRSLFTFCVHLSKCEVRVDGFFSYS